MKAHKFLTLSLILLMLSTQVLSFISREHQDPVIVYQHSNITELFNSEAFEQTLVNKKQHLSEIESQNISLSPASSLDIENLNFIFKPTFWVSKRPEPTHCIKDSTVYPTYCPENKHLPTVCLDSVGKFKKATTCPSEETDGQTVPVTVPTYCPHGTGPILTECPDGKVVQTKCPKHQIPYPATHCPDGTQVHTYCTDGTHVPTFCKASGGPMLKSTQCSNGKDHVFEVATYCPHGQGWIPTDCPNDPNIPTICMEPTECPGQHTLECPDDK